MTPQEMGAMCVKAINSATEIGMPIEDANVLLVLPKGWKKPQGRFPKRVIAQQKPDGSRVVYIKAMSLLAWLAANGLVRVETKVKSDATQP